MILDRFTTKEELERASRWFVGLVFLLLALGSVMVYSARAIKVARIGEDPTDPLIAHIVKVGFGVVGMLFMMRIDYRILGRHYGKIFLVTVVTLVLVLVPGLGAEINGARRWFLLIGSQMVQPSEFAKLALIIVVASLIVRAGKEIEHFGSGSMLPVLATILICILILSAPDFGTTVISGCLAVTLLVIGGVKIKHFLLLILALAPLLLFYGLGNLDHVLYRIITFFDRPPGGQVDFSLMAMASGGALGQGLGASLSKLYFIPECESDFIFSVIGEELGFLGTSMLLLIYVGLIVQGIRIVLGVKNRFGFIMAAGIMLLISTQALVNIAVVVGMAPTKGLPLPFVSSGGSSLIALMMAVGLLLNIARNPDLASVPIRDELFENGLNRLVARFRRVSMGGGNDL